MPAPLPVLLVDDDPTSLLMLEMLFVGNGCAVTTATDGVAALAAFKARRVTEPFVLLVTDFDMPNMSGPQLLAAVTAEAPRPVTVLMSSEPLDVMQHRAAIPKEALVHDYFFKKPITKPVLEQILAHAFRLRQL